MKRAPISASLSLILACAVGTSAIAQSGSSHQTPRHDAHFAHTALSFDVHIAPSTMAPGNTSIDTGSDTWNARGYDLKTLLSQIYSVDPRRIELPANVDSDARYDLTASLPADLDDDKMQQVLTEALEHKFNLTIAPESRQMDVYVLSAPAGPGSQLHRHASADDESRITYMGRQCSRIASGGIAVSATTIADFGRSLEGDLDRVLVDETRLAGSYDFQIASYSDQNTLFQALQSQLGLTVTSTQRNVTVLTVKPAESLQAKL